MADYRYSCVESFKEGSHYILDWADDLWLGSSGSLVLGFDYIALLLCAMTGVVFMFVFLSLCAPHQANKSGLVLCLVLTEILVLTAFISYNIFVFFVCFEAAAIPMFLAIAHYGSTNKRTFAAAQFAGYTVLSSAFAFPGVLMLYYKFNTANYLYMLGNLALLSASDKIILFVVFGLAFAVKTPLVPFHS